MTPTCEFDLVPESGTLAFDQATWLKAKFLLLEFQPAKRLRLIDGPEPRIRVHAYGADPEVAPALLQRLEELAGTALRVEAR